MKFFLVLQTDSEGKTRPMFHLAGPQKGQPKEFATPQEAAPYLESANEVWANARLVEMNLPWRK